METEIKKTTLSRALLASLFSGFITAIAIILYSYFYREGTGFEGYDVVLSPIPIFIGIPLLQIIGGTIYFLLVNNIAKGEILFIAIITILMFAGLFTEINLSASGGQPLLTIPHGLLFGMEIIIGLSLSVFLPFLAHHPKIYMTSEELMW